MRRFVGLVPVAVLSLAAAISALVGLSLSHDSPRSVADELGCTHVVSLAQRQSGVSKETCSYRGEMIVILMLSKGGHALYAADLLNHVVWAIPGHLNAMVECQRRDDCVEIHRQLGGELMSTSGPMLGISIVAG